MRRKTLVLATTLVLMAGFSTNALAMSKETVNSTIQTEKNSDQGQQAKTGEQTEAGLSLDLTPKFEIERIAAQIGSEGQFEIKPIANVTDNSGTYQATIKDSTIISVDEKGRWQALKAGETSLTLDYTYSVSALKEINEKYPDHEIVEGKTSQAIKVVVTTDATQTLDITPKLAVTDMKSLMVGDTGTIKVEPVEGIAVTGKFMPIAETDSIISFDEKGNWKALRAGDKQFPLLFEYSKESLEEIQTKFPNHTLITKDIAQLATVKIYDGTISLRPVLTQKQLDVKVGETGKFTLEPIGGVDNLAAVYTIVDDSGVIEVDKEGNWKALKTGETTVATHVELTAESLKRIKEKNPDKMEATETMVQPMLAVKVTEKPLTPKVIDPKAVTPGKKKLPQTSDNSPALLMLLGSMIIGGAVTLKWQLKVN